MADAGQDGWGAAVTASSAALGGLFLLLITVGAVLAYSIADSGNSTLIAGLNDFAWACVVLTSFPRAMLIMAGTFGFWRAGLISKQALRGGGCSRRARLAGRHHVAERWNLGSGRRLFAVRLAHHRRRVGPGREPGPLDPKSCYACGMVMPTLSANSRRAAASQRRGRGPLARSRSIRPHPGRVALGLAAPGGAVRATARDRYHRPRDSLSSFCRSRARRRT